MALEAGQQWLHYRLVEKIGEGGMGAVWRATDTTLNRDVAIKVLPEQVAADPERRARFEREARLLATLNHPNIATVYGFHDAEGTHFLAMELVEGEDLAQRIDRGPVPCEQAVEIAHQIAGAFEVAHESGIIHRDLKPANVRITPDGKVKVLDFGLAKGLDPAPQDSDPHASPTVTSLGTMAGMILGTAAYMSPEQARGHAADRRSDVWAFGALFYEMLSGNRPFDGGTASDTLAAVLRAEPDLATIPPGTPAAIKTLVRRCLAKDPRQRLQSFADARAWIEDARQLPEEDDAAPPAPVETAPSSRLPWLIAALAVVAAVALGVAWRLTLPEPPPPVHAAIVLDPPPAAGSNTAELLPDGHRIVHIGNRDGERQIWLRHLSEIESRAIHGTAGDPILGDLSPDGAWLVYSVEGRLRKSPIEGGASVSLAPVSPTPRGASWSTDGFIYYAPGTSHPIMRVGEDGGDPEQMTKLPDSTNEEVLSQTNSHRWPTILPGNRGLIYLAGLAGNFAEARVELLDLESGETRVLQTAAVFPRYLSSGHIAFVYGGDLTVMGFDAATLEVTSPPVAMVTGVRHMFGNGAAYYSVADNGTLLYTPGKGAQVEIQLQRFTPDGVINLSDVAAILHPRISPDGRYVAYSKELGTLSDIWVYDQERDVATRLTLEPNVPDYTPIWGPDEKWITYASGSDGANLDIYRKRADGSGEAELVLADEVDMRPFDWSSDGSMLLFSKRTTDGDPFDLYLQRFDESGEPAGESVGFVTSRDIDLHGAFSPDDRFVAYHSRESGVDQVYLSRVDGAGRWQVSNADGGQAPRWSADGRRIYYLHGVGSDSEIRFVDVSVVDGSPKLGRPRVALATPLAGVQSTSASFDVHPVDESLVVTSALWELENSGHPVLVQGWGEALSRR